MSWFRGTTPTIYCSLPYALNELSSLYITFSDRSGVILEKTMSDVTETDTGISFTLTQEETLLFKSGNTIEIQGAIKTLDGKVFRSYIVSTNAERILKDEPI